MLNISSLQFKFGGQIINRVHIMIHHHIIALCLVPFMSFFFIQNQSRYLSNIFSIFNPSRILSMLGMINLVNHGMLKSCIIHSYFSFFNRRQQSFSSLLNALSLPSIVIKHLILQIIKNQCLFNISFYFRVVSIWFKTTSYPIIKY